MTVVFANGLPDRITPMHEVIADDRVARPGPRGAEPVRRAPGGAGAGLGRSVGGADARSVEPAPGDVAGRSARSTPVVPPRGRGR